MSINSDSSCTSSLEGLSEAHKRAWIEFIVAQAEIFRAIEREMAMHDVVSPDVYDVLLNLEDAPGRMMRMSDLADAVVLSRSGITRLTDRLEREGLVARKACPNDRRSMHVALTDKGLAERQRAWPFYRDAIAKVFAAHMSEDEANVVADVFSRMRTTRKCGGKE